MLSLNGITDLGNVKARSIGLINATGNGYDDVKTLIANSGGSGTVTSATSPLTIASGVLAIDLSTYATTAAVNTSVNTAINTYATTDSALLSAALNLKQSTLTSSTDLQIQDATVRNITASGTAMIINGGLITLVKDNANNTLMSLENAGIAVVKPWDCQNTSTFRKTITIYDATNSLTGQLYIGPGNNLRWQGQNVIDLPMLNASIATAIATKQDALSGISQTAQNTSAADTKFNQHTLTISSHSVGNAQSRISFDYATGSSAFLAADAGNFVIYGLDPTIQIGFYNSAGYAFRSLANSLNCVVGSSLTQNSDARLKEDVKDASVEQCVQIFDKVSVKTYKRNDFETDKTRIGFIAQDFDNILPIEFQNIVSRSPWSQKNDSQEQDDTEEMLGLDYARITCVLWNVVKKLTQRVTALENATP